MIPPLREFVLAAGSSLPAAIVTKATVVAAFGLIGVRLARRSRAALRHVLLAAAFGVLLLLPVASLLAPPVRIAVPTEAQEHAVVPSVTTEIDSPLLLAPTGTHSAATPTLARSFMLSLSSLLLFAWLSGMALSLVPLIAGLAKIRALRRTGLPWSGGQALTDRMAKQAGILRPVQFLLHEALPGPFASGMLHPAILLPADAQLWEGDDLDRAVVHELEHVRRADVVVHSIARAVCAVYWFHPLVWMAWRQLVLEAERSCDDAVIARSEATAYADQLVALARKLLASEKLPLLAMANRSDLATRVSAVLDARQRRGRAGPVAVALACAAVGAIILGVSPLRTASEPQSNSNQSAIAPNAGARAPLPSFEVASIKRTDPSDSRIHILFPPGRFSAVNITVMQLLVGNAFAVKEFQISKAPNWVRTTKYTIEAKESDSLAEALEKLPLDRRMAECRLLVRSLLVDRFRLRVSHETRNAPVYALVLVKDGPKFHEARAGDAYPNGIRARDGRPFGQANVVQSGRGLFVGQGIPFMRFVDTLENELGRPVLDQTGLKGTYDFSLRWAAEQGSVGIVRAPQGHNMGAANAPNPAGPSLFAALQEQLGLKLESTRAPVDVIVIDHIERPSPN